MLYAITFHLLAGVTTGSVFKVHALLPLSGFVFLEALLLGHADGTVVAPWVLANLVTIQVGYLLGIFARGIFEQTTDSPSRTRTGPLP